MPRFSVAVLTLVLCGVCTAQDLDPRRYVNLPTGQNFLALAYSYSEGDVSVAPSVPLQDAFLRIDGPALGYLRTFSMAGKSSSMDIQQPYVCVAGNALLDGERVSAQRCGLADMTVRISHNFIGAEALTLGEFRNRPKEVVVGASVQINIPSGDYDKTKLINIGANRWFIKPEIGMTIPWQKWSVEFAAGVRLFTDNNKYLESSTLSQDPLYNLQAHVHFDISRRQSMSLSSNYFFGGKTYRDGAPAAISQANSRLGLSWSYALNPHHIVKLTAHSGVITRIGNDSDTLTLVWSYRWD